MICHPVLTGINEATAYLSYYILPYTSGCTIRARDNDFKFSFPQNVTVVCAGKRALLQCNTGKRVKVTQARWGGGNAVTCTNSTSADLSSLPLIADSDSSQVTDQIRKRCAKQQTCEVEANRPFLESVPSGSKYLKVWHECIPDVSGVILPSRRKRDIQIQRRELHLTQLGSAKNTGSESFGEGLETSASHNSSSEGVVASVFVDKSNEQISSNKNESTASKEKRSDEDYKNSHLARVLDELLGPSSLYK